MRVVIDANVVVAAAVRPTGWTAEEVRRPELQLFAPDWIRNELAEHEDEFSTKAGCEIAAWRVRVAKVLDRVHLVPGGRLVLHAHHPLVRAVQHADPDDAPYVATFLEVDADFLWTRDEILLMALAGRAGPIVP